MSENHNLASADWKNAGGLQEREIVAGATDFEVNTYKLKHFHDGLHAYNDKILANVF